jgi:hypothetical protein
LLKDLGLFESCVGPVICYTVLDFFSFKGVMPAILASLRISMATKLNRAEDPLTSVCCAVCCYSCALAQLQRDAFNPKGPYAFDRAQGACETVTTYAGAIHGNVHPYVPVTPEVVPLIPVTQNSMPVLAYSI